MLDIINGTLLQTRNRIECGLGVSCSRMGPYQYVFTNGGASISILSDPDHHYLLHNTAQDAWRLNVT